VIYVGNRVMPAVTPHLGASWHTDSGWILTVQDMLRILPARHEVSVGLYNHLAVGGGYAWKSGNFTLGVALPAYFLLACVGKQCARVAGLGSGDMGRAASSIPTPWGCR
jgi:hypothetical protein